MNNERTDRRKDRQTDAFIIIDSHPNPLLSSYAVVGSFWENFLPYYKNALTGLYLTLHPNASPEISYVPWVVSENPVDAIGDLSHVTLKTQVMTVTGDMRGECSSQCCQ